MRIIRAVADKVIVAVPKKGERKTSGGLVIPSTIEDTETYSEGIVTSIGEEVNRIEVGDHITFHKHGGQAFFMGGQEYRVLMAKEIYGIVEES